MNTPSTLHTVDDQYGTVRRGAPVSVVVVAAWHAAGCPAPDWTGKSRTPKPAPRSRPGVCALTGERGEVWPLAKVTSTLTTLDRLRYRDIDPDGVALGPAGAWALRLRVQMQRPHVLDADGFREVDPPGLHAALVALPSDPHGWVGVPQSRQKHLLAWAQPGTVRVDDEDLVWTVDDVERLHVYGRLRALGFGEAALAEPVPRGQMVIRLAASARREVLATWARLDVWRAHPAYLDVAARATRKPKET